MIGIAWPSKKVKKIFNNKAGIIFINEYGLWKYSSIYKKRFLLSTNIQDKIIKNKFNVNLARSYLNWWQPLWTRWVPNADQYEKFKEQSLFSIYKIFTLLNYFKIKNLIFHTSVAHHIDVSLVSIACRLSTINQIYLYCENIAGRLLPIIEYNGINSRVPLNLALSNYKYNKKIEEFKNNYFLNYFPKNNLSVKKWMKSIFIAIIFILRREINHTIKNFFFIKQYKNSILIEDKIIEYSLIEDLRIINNQRLYIKSLLKSEMSNKNFDELRLNKKPKLLIMAHYQPEASSFPEGDRYYNHIDIALTIRNKGYKDKILYKEHPSTLCYLQPIIGLTKVGTTRSKEYLDLLKKMGCVFLPTNKFLSFEKNYNWCLPITITGTIAVERSLIGLHTIYTGSPYWKNMPGTIHIDQIKSLENLPKEWTKIDVNISNKTKSFLLNLLNNKTITNISGIGSGVFDNAKESEKNFKSAILKISKLLNNNLKLQ